MAQSVEEIKSNCPRDCYDGCGILVKKQDGQVKQVLGDPDHPVSRGRLCSKCAVVYNGVWQDPRARLLKPLKRSGKKGEGKFEEIGWDEAISTVADNFKSAIESHGASSIVTTHYSGTLSLIALLFPERFQFRLGCTLVRGDTICNAAGHAAWGLLFGESHIGFDPRTIRDSKSIIVWGANPAHSGPHANKHWLPESPAKVIVVDPVRTETAAQADIHLQPFPGSDAALAFAMLNVLKQENMLDQDFIDANTIGADEIQSTIDACTAEWGEEQSGVPAELIREAALAYGAGPSLLWAGQGLQRQVTGGNIFRAIGLLPAMTGNIGKPGAGFYYLNMTPAVAGIDFDKLVGAELLSEEPPSISHMDFAEHLSKPDLTRAMLCWNTNPVASVPNYSQFCEAMQREDLFTVVIDCFETDTVKYADIVLPAASFLEFDDLTFSYFHMIMGVQSKVSEPMGESLPNQEIFRRLARAMDFEEAQLYQSDTELIDGMMNEMNLDMNFEEFKKKGHITVGDEPIIFFEDLKFPTPSGKIEIASSKAEEQGLPRTPQPWADEKPESGKFRILSPASNWRMNDSYANDPEIIRRSGPASATFHPEDARQLGISSSDRVALYNETGKVELEAEVSEQVPRGVILSYKGRWPGLEDGNHMNAIHRATSTDMGESSSVHSTEVNVEILPA